MPRFTEQEIKDQEQRVKEKEDQLAEEKALLKAMRRLSLPAPGSTETESTATGSNFATGTIDISVVGVASKKQEKPTLKDHMKGVISRINQSQDFTVSHVYAILEKLGDAPKGKHARSRIAVLMKELEYEKFVIKTIVGRGSDPHKYKLAPKENLLFDASVNISNALKAKS